ncbi:MAG: hypothetical protein LBF02_00855 [Mycoplasmataceae bacterium]|jgi:DNA polymerase III delta prime subunit|nr:hypothetical protein [Mycoplasmataceae bacterium]
MNDILGIPNKINNILLNIVELTDVDEFLKEYVNGIILNKKNIHYNVNNNILKNAKMLDCKKQKIKREDIIKLIASFSYSSLNSENIKICIIKNIEYATIEVINSLLKFIEEENNNEYKIFTTQNLKQVYPTLLSRLPFFNVSFKEKTLILLEEILIQEGLKVFFLNNKEVILSLYKDLDELKQDIKNGIIVKIIDFCESLLSRASKSSLVLKVNKFTTFNYEEIKIICMVLFYKTNKEKLIDIIENINLNINKYLLFNEICEILKN